MRAAVLGWTFLLTCGLVVACEPAQQDDQLAKAGCADIAWLMSPGNLQAASTDVRAHTTDAVSLLGTAAASASRYRDLAGGMSSAAARIEQDGYSSVLLDAPLVTVLEALNGDHGCGKWGFA